MTFEEFAGCDCGVAALRHRAQRRSTSRSGHRAGRDVRCTPNGPRLSRYDAPEQYVRRAILNAYISWRRQWSVRNLVSFDRAGAGCTRARRSEPSECAAAGRPAAPTACRAGAALLRRIRRRRDRRATRLYHRHRALACLEGIGEPALPTWAAPPADVSGGIMSTIEDEITDCSPPRRRGRRRRRPRCRHRAGNRPSQAPTDHWDSGGCDRGHGGDHGAGCAAPIGAAGTASERHAPVRHYTGITRISTLAPAWLRPVWWRHAELAVAGFNNDKSYPAFVERAFLSGNPKNKGRSRSRISAPPRMCRRRAPRRYG